MELCSALQRSDGVTMALPGVQLISQLQTHFLRLAQLSAAAEVEFRGHASNLQNAVLEAQTAVEYAVSRALLGDKASARIAHDKVLLAEEAFEQCQERAKELRGVEQVRQDCREKLAEVRAQLELLRRDLIDAEKDDDSNLNAASTVLDRAPMSQASPPRYRFGTGIVRTIGAGAPPAELSPNGVLSSRNQSIDAATFGRSKIRSNLEEVDGVANHLDGLLASDALAEAVEGLDICFDLLWEARALFDARRNFQEQREWQLHLHQRLHSTRESLSDLEQQVAVARQQAVTAMAASRASPGKNASELHRQAELRRLTAAGIGQLDELLKAASESVQELADFVDAGGGRGEFGAPHSNGHGKVDAEGSDSGDSAQQLLESHLSACEAEFLVVRQRLANPLYALSPLQSPRRERAATNAAMLQYSEAAPGTPQIGSLSLDDSLSFQSEQEEGFPVLNGTEYGGGISPFDEHHEGVVAGEALSDEFEYDEPPMLSSSQIARRAFVHRKVLSVLRGRRRRRQRERDEEAEKNKKIRDERVQLQQRKQRQQQRARSKVRAKRRKAASGRQTDLGDQSGVGATGDALALSQGHTLPNARMKITHLPAATASELTMLAELFFPHVGSRDGHSKPGVASGPAPRREATNAVIRTVMQHSSVDLAEFLQLVDVRNAAVSTERTGHEVEHAPGVSESVVARVFRAIDVHGQGSVHPFDFLLGILAVGFAAVYVDVPVFLFLRFVGKKRAQ